MKHNNAFLVIIRTARKILQETGEVYILYKRGKGFMCRRQLSEVTEAKMLEGLISLVGFYTLINTSDIVADLNFELDEQLRAA